MNAPARRVMIRGPITREDDMLEGKNAFITGGGKGQGRAIALALAKQGARVAVGGRDAASLEKTVKEIADAGGNAIWLPCDVTSKKSVREAAAKIGGEWKQVHILVNNAGVGGMTPIDSEDDERWRVILNTDLVGMIEVCRAFAPLIPEGAGGRIINISSVLGRFGVPGYGAYCAAKHGVVGLTRALAHELAPKGVTVNCLCPGWVDTAMAWEGMDEISAHIGITRDQFHEQAMSAVPLRRMLAPSEIADTAVFLAGETGRGITGATLDVNCGSFMG